MNLLLLDEKSERCFLPAHDKRFSHLRDVLRLRVGDRFCVGHLNGPRGIAEVAAINDVGCELRCRWNEEKDPGRPGTIALLVPFCRPQTCRKILSEAAAVGLESLTFFGGEKSDAGYAQSKLWTSGEAEDLLRAGSEQAFQTRIPALSLVSSLAVGLEAMVNNDEAGSLRVALDNYEASTRLASVLLQPPQGINEVVLAIGGERGWSQAEREALRASGFILCHLGPEVMRTETAVVAAVTLTRELLFAMESQTPAVNLQSGLG
jgi:16S rRNA (uracil1498-N3)-methyltransferase